MNDARRGALRNPSTRHRVPGVERSPAPHVRKRVTGRADRVRVDRDASIAAIERGGQDGPDSRALHTSTRSASSVKAVDQSGFLCCEVVSLDNQAVAMRACGSFIGQRPGCRDLEFV